MGFGPFSSESTSKQEGDISADQSIFAGPAAVGRRNTVVGGDLIKVGRGATVNLETTITGSDYGPATAAGLLRSAIEGQANDAITGAAGSIRSDTGIDSKTLILIAALGAGLVALVLVLRK